MGMLYEYSNEELKAMGLLSEEELAQKERMRDKHQERTATIYESLRDEQDY